MNAEKTLSIVKPDAVEKNVIGTILARFENSGLNVVAAKMIWLSTRDAKKFYEVHKTKPFYRELVEYMASGPLLVQVLEGVNAINNGVEEATILDGRVSHSLILELFTEHGIGTQIYS